MLQRVSSLWHILRSRTIVGMDTQSRLNTPNERLHAHHCSKILAVKRSPPHLHVWTSTLVRTHQTIEHLGPYIKTKKAWKELDEIDAGICDMLSKCKFS